MKFMNNNSLLAEYYDATQGDDHRLFESMLDSIDLKMVWELATALGDQFMGVIKQPHTDAAKLQHLCEAANAAAKEVDNRYYHLKDWGLLNLVYRHQNECKFRSTWGMTEIVCRTEEYGETSYHTFNEKIHQFVDETDEDWCGVRRQLLALQWETIDRQFKKLIIDVSLHPTYEGKLELSKLAKLHGYPCWTDIDDA